MTEGVGITHISESDVFTLSQKVVGTVQGVKRIDFCSGSNDHYPHIIWNKQYIK